MLRFANHFTQANPLIQSEFLGARSRDESNRFLMREGDIARDVQPGNQIICESLSWLSKAEAHEAEKGVVESRFRPGFEGQDRGVNLWGREERRGGSVYDVRDLERGLQKDGERPAVSAAGR